VSRGSARSGNQYIQTLRDEMGKIREARERETRKVELVEQRMHVVTEERDALKQELHESKAALEEIKRSIMDTNLQSQMTYYETESKKMEDLNALQSGVAATLKRASARTGIATEPFFSRVLAARCLWLTTTIAVLRPRRITSARSV